MKKLAILSPSNNAISETFIAAHRQLPFPITFIYGKSTPYIEEKKGLTKITKIKIGLLKGLKILFKSIKPESTLLYFLLKRNKINVVLAEYGITAADSLDAIKKAKCKLIVHFHGFDASVNDVLAQYKNNYLEVFKYAACVIVVSKLMQEKILALGCPPEKIILNYYGPNPRFAELQPNLNLKNFIAVGRFVDKKAPYFTILSFQKVVEEHRDAQLTFIGEGALLNTCKNLATALKLQNNVLFLGAKNIDTVIEQFNNSVAFVQHSITADNGDSEGTPVAILEAQLAGLPVIATKHAGIPDVVIHNQTGYLTDEHDVDLMAAYMLKIINDKEQTKRLSVNAKLHIQHNFSLQKHLDTLTKLVNNAC